MANLSQNIESTVKTSKTRRHCDYQLCEFSAMKLIGECKSCNNFYCHIHRINETHRCKNLDQLRQREKRELEARLLEESTSKKYRNLFNAFN